MKKGKKKPSFRTKLIFLTLSACIISTLILGIAQMVLSVFHFSRQARSDLEFYLENTSGQFDTRIKNMENMVISLRHNNVLKHFIAGEAYNEQEAREQFANSTDLFSEMNMVDSASPFIDCIYLFNENGFRSKMTESDLMWKSRRRTKGRRWKMRSIRTSVLPIHSRCFIRYTVKKHR